MVIMLIICMFMTSCGVTEDERKSSNKENPTLESAYMSNRMTDAICNDEHFYYAKYLGKKWDTGKYGIFDENNKLLHEVQNFSTFIKCDNDYLYYCTSGKYKYYCLDLDSLVVTELFEFQRDFIDTIIYNDIVYYQCIGLEYYYHSSYLLKLPVNHNNTAEVPKLKFEVDRAWGYAYPENMGKEPLIRWDKYKYRHIFGIVNDRVYFAYSTNNNKKFNIIASSNLDGTNEKVVFDVKQYLGDRCFVEIATIPQVEGEHLYCSIADKDENYLYRINMQTKTSEKIDVESAFEFFIANENIYINTICEPFQTYVVKKDGLTVSKFDVKGAVIEGVNKKHIYFSKGDKFGRVDLTGENVEYL